MNLASTIDHTLLKPDSRREDILKLCDEANQFGFHAVCIPPYFVREAARALEQSKVKTATVIGFPYGYAATPAKVEEIKRAINDGADEVDIVVNICAVRGSDWAYVKNDIESMTMAAHLKGKAVKVIFETPLLSKEEILKLCEICSVVKVDFVKTSTGVHGGATAEIIELLRKELPEDIKIKASGGIESPAQAMQLLKQGADRLGTSKGVGLVAGFEEE